MNIKASSKKNVHGEKDKGNALTWVEDIVGSYSCPRIVCKFEY